MCKWAIENRSRKCHHSTSFCAGAPCRHWRLPMSPIPKSSTALKDKPDANQPEWSLLYTFFHSKISDLLTERLRSLSLVEYRATHLQQWRPVPFKIWEANYYFYEHGLISITAYWMTVIHIHPAQCNIGLGYHMVLKCAQFPSCCYNLAYEWNLQCWNLSNQGDKHWHIQYHLTILLIKDVIISPAVANESFYWTNLGMFIPILFRLLHFKKRFSTESAGWIHPTITRKRSSFS